MNNDLGETTHIEVVEKFTDAAGKSVVDVGCGDGTFARTLAEHGAKVLAIDPNLVNTEPSQGVGGDGEVTFAQVGADAIPLESGGADIVFFNRSLHHIPAEAMDAALHEAGRVLDPDRGILCVIEPEMSGSWSQLMKPFNDETEVRQLAQQALDRTAASLFSEGEGYRYSVHVHYPDFETFAARRPVAIYREQGQEIDTPEVRQLFDVGKTAQGYVFLNTMRLRLFYRKPQAR